MGLLKKKGLKAVRQPRASKMAKMTVKALPPSMNVTEQLKELEKMEPSQRARIQNQALMNVVKSEPVKAKMIEYIRLHGVTPLPGGENLAGQTYSIRKKYEDMYKKERRKQFNGDDEQFNRFMSSGDNEEMMNRWIDEQETALGFLGFDGNGSQDFQHILPIAALGLGKLGKKVGSKILPAIKKVGQKIVGTAKKAKEQSDAAREIGQDIQLKSAQMEAMKAGVPPEAIREGLKNAGISEDKLKKVAGTIIQKDAENAAKVIEEITKVYLQAQAMETEERKQDKKDFIMYAGIGIAVLLLLFIIMKKS